MESVKNGAFIINIVWNLVLLKRQILVLLDIRLLDYISLTCFSLFDLNNLFFLSVSIFIWFYCLVPVLVPSIPSCVS